MTQHAWIATRKIARDRDGAGAFDVQTEITKENEMTNSRIQRVWPSRTPWVWVPSDGDNLGFFKNQFDEMICDFGESTQYYPTEGSEPAPSDIDFILRCVNSHDALLEACKAALIHMDDLRGPDALKVKAQFRTAIQLAEGEMK